jgi:hypothetical protein
LPGAEGLSYLAEEFTDVIARAEEVCFRFEQKTAGFYEGVAGVAELEKFEVEGRKVVGIFCRVGGVTEVVMQLQVLCRNSGGQEKEQAEPQVFHMRIFEREDRRRLSGRAELPRNCFGILDI